MSRLMMRTTVAKPRPGRPKQPEKRDRLIGLARIAFADLGYAGASLGEIASRAQLTKAAVLHHFGSKQGLYFAVLGELVSDLGSLVSEALAGSAAFDVRLDRLGEAVVEYLGRNPSAAKLLLAELIGRGPFAQGPGADQVTTAMRSVKAFLDAGIRSGDVHVESTAQLAMSIVGVHLVYFAAADVTQGLLDSDPFTASVIEDRKRAVTQTVRAMCGVPNT